MFDNEHVPFISRIHWSWAWVLSVATGGVFPLLLGLYFAWWVRRRLGRGIAVFIYSIEIVALCLLYVGAHLGLRANFVEDAASIVFVAWIATALVLRSELRQLYGKQFEMNPFLTILFTVLYLNYCLWAIGDAPFYEKERTQ